MTMDTTAWSAMMSSLVDMLLTFPCADSQTLADVLGDRFYCGTAPDNAQVPYAELRFVNGSTTPGNSMDRMTLDAEIQIFGRPRDTQALVVENAADRICAALKQFTDATSGLVSCVALRRDTLPPFSDPADRRFYQVRVVANLFVWPRFLTQYSHPNGA